MRPERLAIVLVVAGCTSGESQKPPPEPARPSALLTGTTPQHMRNCPSGVPNTRTQATPTPDGVDVVITSPDPDVVRTHLFKLAALQTKTWQRPRVSSLLQHSGLHAGPGSIGHCPIIHADTIVTWVPVENGVRIHVAVRAGRDPSELQRATLARVSALMPPSS